MILNNVRHAIQPQRIGDEGHRTREDNLTHNLSLAEGEVLQPGKRQQGRVCKPFHQVSRSITRTPAGTAFRSSSTR